MSRSHLARPELSLAAFSCRSGKIPPTGPAASPDWLKMKNADAPAAPRASRVGQWRQAGDSIAIGARGSLGAPATSAQERSTRSEKQDPRHCLEVWSCLSLWRMAESSAGDFTVAKYRRLGGSELKKCIQQKRNIIHMSSTAYEQDHSAAAPPSSVIKSRRLMSNMDIPPSQGSVCPKLRMPQRGWRVLWIGLNHSESRWSRLRPCRNRSNE
jgi:hypothetical protein